MNRSRTRFAVMVKASTARSKLTTNVNSNKDVVAIPAEEVLVAYLTEEVLVVVLAEEVIVVGLAEEVLGSSHC